MHAPTRRIAFQMAGIALTVRRAEVVADHQPVGSSRKEPTLQLDTIRGREGPAVLVVLVPPGKEIDEEVFSRVGEAAGFEPPTWLDHLRAAVRIRLAGRAVASHRAAARLHGFWDGSELDVTVRYPHQGSCQGVLVHRSRDVVAGVVTSIDGIPVTTASRTICDLGLVVPPWDVRRALEHALATGVVTRQQVEAVRWGVSEHGRTGVSAVDEALLAIPQNATAAESGPEVRLLSLLQQAGLEAPVPQHRVRVDGRRYRLDLAYPDAKLAIEYDGESFHSTPMQKASDRTRQERLERAGWRVLRFTRHDLYSPTDGAIVRQISEALRSNRDL